MRFGMRWSRAFGIRLEREPVLVEEVGAMSEAIGRHKQEIHGS